MIPPYINLAATTTPTTNGYDSSIKRANVLGGGTSKVRLARTKVEATVSTGLQHPSSW